MSTLHNNKQMRMAKKSKIDLDAARELAQIMYMSGIQNKEIAERVNVSPVTITNWVTDNGWKEKRAAKTITRTELINKTLERINEMLQGDDLNADKLSKLAILIERLDKKNSPVLAMEVFIDFACWLQQQATGDRAITVDLIKQINKYQDSYITSKLSV